MAPMKIAITGGAGFIGTVLADILKEQGHDLVLADLHLSKKYPAHSVIADVRDQQALIRAFKGVDVIYHLAAEHRDDVQPIQKYYDVNVGGAENVIAAAQAHNIQTIIFTSSVALYGLDAGNSKEKDTPNPFNDYGASKWQSEGVFNAWALADKARSLTMVRLVATFGPGNRGNIYNLMNQIARGRFVMVGNGENQKSIAYVRNVAAFLHHCLNSGSGLHLYNYADKPDLTMNDFVTSVRKDLGLQGIGPRLPYAIGIIGGRVLDVAAKVTGKNFPISAIRVEKFCANTIVNADRARQTGFVQPFTLREGIDEMVRAEFTSTQEAA